MSFPPTLGTNGWLLSNQLEGLIDAGLDNLPSADDGDGQPDVQGVRLLMRERRPIVGSSSTEVPHDQASAL